MRSSSPGWFRWFAKSGGHRGETAAPNKCRQLRGIGGTGADGLNPSNSGLRFAFRHTVSKTRGHHYGDWRPRRIRAASLQPAARDENTVQINSDSADSADSDADDSDADNKSFLAARSP
jgi:hypothetical protein